MSSPLEDAVIRALDKRSRVAVARVAGALPSQNVEDVPGRADYLWGWTPPGDPGRDAYEVHRGLNGSTIEGGGEWPGVTFHGTAPHVGDHDGCQCIVDIEDVTVRVSASQPTVSGSRVVVHWQVGADAGGFAQRYRATALVPGGIRSLIPGATDAQEQREATDRGRYVRTAASLVRAAA